MSTEEVEASSSLLGFLAQGLVKSHSKPSSIKEMLVWDEEEKPSPEINFAELHVKESRDLKLREALDSLHKSRMRADSYTYAQILRQCGKSKALMEGKLVHEHITKGGFEPDTYLANLLMQMYGNCGSLVDARRVFSEMAYPNIYSWNIMIAAYAQNGYVHDARLLFDKMPLPNVVSWNAMVTAYAQNGNIQEARNMFDQMPLRDTVSWNSMITACSHNGQASEAVQLFRLMDLEGQFPDRTTFLSTLAACSCLNLGKILHVSILESGLSIGVAIATALVTMYSTCASPDDAKIVFDRMPQWDVVVWTAMLAAYAQAGQIEKAREVFDEMPERNVVSWTSMIAAYAHKGNKQALKLFRQMDIEGIQPNKITFVSVLYACASIQVLSEGVLIHSQAADVGLQTDVSVANALINMYGKCASVANAQKVFLQMPQRDVVSWSAIIAAFAQNGYGKVSLQLFRAMQVEGVKPNEITVISILSACSHGGLFADGIQYFLTVPPDYDLRYNMDHYVCLVDILGRAGQFDKAEELIHNMPYEPGVAPWISLLGACKALGKTEKCAHISKQLNRLTSTSPYVLLSSAYAR